MLRFFFFFFVYSLQECYRRKWEEHVNVRWKFMDAVGDQVKIYERLIEQRKARGDLDTCIFASEINAENPPLAHSIETFYQRIRELLQELRELEDQIKKAEVI